ncbi:MAG: type IV pili methyl-accepting chemotaxis transducer N-terminal domain-containing protein, partial [Betaproteobacteria bacterium]|nr:type IV pili methyl-accepting chemotaxis transducer N-terminal domain-containing protein [Betaproteobacteria bacterium]
MKTILSVCLVFFLGLISECAQAQISDINAAINKAGRQRMLSQRMAKAYFQVGQEVDVERSKKLLDSSVAAFDRQLVELKNY